MLRGNTLPRLVRENSPLQHFGAKGGVDYEHLIKNAWFSMGIWQDRIIVLFSFFLPIPLCVSHSSEDGWCGVVWCVDAFKKPRLRKDWNSLNDPDATHIRSMNAFFDTMFAISITHLGIELRAGQNLKALHDWCQDFGIIVSLWLCTADYSSRFDNDDLSHKIFWGVYGMGTLGMMMHTTGGYESENASYFSLCLAGIYLLLALHYFRNAVALPRCTFFCSLLGSILLTYASIAFYGYYSNADRFYMFWILACGYPLYLAATVTVRWIVANLWYHGNTRDIAHRLDLPLHIEFHINRFSSFAMMLMSQIALAVAVHPEQGFDDKNGLYMAACVAFFLLIAVKLFLFDVDYFDVEDHAIRRSVETALAWLILFPLGVGCLALTGSGICLMLLYVGKSIRQPVDVPFAQGLTCNSLAAFLCIVSLQVDYYFTKGNNYGNNESRGRVGALGMFVGGGNIRCQSKLIELKEETDHKAQARTIYTIHYVQIGCQLAAAMFYVILQSLEWSCLSVMLVIAVTLISLVMVNLIDEFVLLNDAHVRSAAGITHEGKG
eukprot:jgi/Bigna1/74095/fgenesh1_pg.27_\